MLASDASRDALGGKQLLYHYFIIAGWPHFQSAAAGWKNTYEIQFYVHSTDEERLDCPKSVQTFQQQKSHIDIPLCL